MIELKIVIDEKGQIGVSGPLDNPFQCYAMLETARDVINDRRLERAKSAIVPALGVDLAGLKLHG